MLILYEITETNHVTFREHMYFSYERATIDHMLQ